MTQIIDGKKISQEIKDELREQVAEQKKLGKEAVYWLQKWNRRRSLSFRPF